MYHYPHSPKKELLEAGIPFTDTSIDRHRFTNLDYWKMPTAKSIEELTPIALEIIGRLEGAFAIGIGPMRTGPERSFTRNLQIFDHVYEWHMDHNDSLGVPIFYQIAFEIDIHRIRDEKYGSDDEGFLADLFESFYKPILLHDNLRFVIRMPNWEQSKGAMIESGILLTRKEPVKYIDVHPKDIPGLPELMKPEVLQD